MCTLEFVSLEKQISFQLNPQLRAVPVTHLQRGELLIQVLRWMCSCSNSHLDQVLVSKQNLY